MFTPLAGTENDATEPPICFVDLDASHPTLDPDVNRPWICVGYSASGLVSVPRGVDVALTTASTAEQPWVEVADLDESCSRIGQSVKSNPVASVVAAQVVRATLACETETALLVESIAYGMLQGGPEHAAWLKSAHHVAPDPFDVGPDLLVERDEGVLTLTFNRPARRNAYRSRSRDELVEALELAATDTTITSIHLRGAGSTFSSGGDLSEFGHVRDGATAHMIRSRRNAARTLSRVADRSTAFVQGSCYGAGVELSAACASVVAAPGTTFTLPEVAMGLIPGAGGTWSVPRRIGWQRSLWLTVSGETIDVERALEWGLVDRVRADEHRD